MGLLTAAYSRRLPFSRSYGVILPSSLTRVIPFVLQFSCRLPVSVCGTGALQLSLAAFLASVNSSASLTRSASSPSLTTRVLHYASASRFARGFPSPRSDYPSVSLPRTVRRYRNLYLLSIIYAFRPRLRSRLTLGGRTFPRKPLAFDGGVSHSPLATHAGILSCMSSTASSDTASAFIHCSSTNAISDIPKLR